MTFDLTVPHSDFDQEPELQGLAKKEYYSVILEISNIYKVHFHLQNVSLQMALLTETQTITSVTDGTILSAS